MDLRVSQFDQCNLDRYHGGVWGIGYSRKESLDPYDRKFQENKQFMIKNKEPIIIFIDRFLSLLFGETINVLKLYIYNPKNRQELQKLRIAVR